MKTTILLLALSLTATRVFSEDAAPPAAADAKPADGAAAPAAKRSLLKYTDELLSFNEKVVFDLARAQ